MLIRNSERADGRRKKNNDNEQTFNGEDNILADGKSRFGRDIQSRMASLIDQDLSRLGKNQSEVAAGRLNISGEEHESDSVIRTNIRDGFSSSAHANEPSGQRGAQHPTSKTKRAKGRLIHGGPDEEDDCTDNAADALLLRSTERRTLPKQSNIRPAGFGARNEAPKTGGESMAATRPSNGGISRDVAPPQPDDSEEEEVRLMCEDGRVRAKHKAAWEPIGNPTGGPEAILVKSCLVGVLSMFGKKRKRSDVEGTDQNSRSSNGTLVGEDAEDRTNLPNSDPEEIQFEEGDILEAIAQDPFNLATMGNVGMKEVLPNVSPMDRIKNLLVSYSSGVPEPLYCATIAKCFNEEVLAHYNEAVRKKNEEEMRNLESGITKECLVIRMGEEFRIKVDPRTGKLNEEHISVLMSRGSSVPWTSEMVENYRKSQLNPILDMAHMAKRYKVISEALADKEMMFENTESCYSDGRVIRRLNMGNFRSMLKCDEMYIKAMTTKVHLSPYSNRTTAANLGVNVFSNLTLDVETKELVEETCVSVRSSSKSSSCKPGDRGGDKRVLSKQSAMFGAGSGMIGQTSRDGKKTDEGARGGMTTSSGAEIGAAAKRRKMIGLPPGKTGGYSQNKGINHFK
jgi:hypothetical protein